MRKINDGGPAFPQILGERYEPMSTEGMSLRDYFAAKAMQGYISGCLHIARAEYIQSAVKSSYEIADAMIEARKTKNNPE
jgi:hypothetical protein